MSLLESTTSFEQHRTTVASRTLISAVVVTSTLFSERTPVLTPLAENWLVKGFSRDQRQFLLSLQHR